MEEKMTNEPNTRCVECGKTYYSIQGACHKEEDEKFFDITHTGCSNKNIRCGTMASDVKKFISKLLKTEYNKR